MPVPPAVLGTIVHVHPGGLAKRRAVRLATGIALLENPTEGKIFFGIRATVKFDFFFFPKKLLEVNNNYYRSVLLQIQYMQHVLRGILLTGLPQPTSLLLHCLEHS